MSNSAIQIPFFVSTEAEVVGAPGLRNRIMNGQLGIWQRGTIFDTVASPGNITFYTADRWAWNLFDDGGTFSVVPGSTRISRQDFPFPTATLEPDSYEEGYFLRWAQSHSGGTGFERSVLLQRIEGVGTLNGGKATLSFWARSTSGGTILINLKQDFGNFGDPDVFTAYFPVTLSTSFVHYVFTFDVPSIDGKLIGPNDHLEVRFLNLLGAAAAVAAGTIAVDHAFNIDIANVQIERGEITNPIFVNRTRALELPLCQRYYEEGFFDESEGGGSTALTNEKCVNFTVFKRVIPSIIFFLREQPVTPSHVEPGSILAAVHNNYFSIRWEATVGFTEARIQTALSDNITPGPWKADAEL